MDLSPRVRFNMWKEWVMHAMNDLRYHQDVLLSQIFVPVTSAPCDAVIQHMTNNNNSPIENERLHTTSVNKYGLHFILPPPPRGRASLVVRVPPVHHT